MAALPLSDLCVHLYVRLNVFAVRISNWSDVIMVLFVQSVLGRCFAGHVQRRTCLGLGGVACVLAAGLAAYGVNSGFGEPRRSRCTLHGESPLILNVDPQEERNSPSSFVYLLLDRSPFRWRKTREKGRAQKLFCRIRF